MRTAVGYVAAIVFLVLAAAYARIEHPRHDEGTTFDLATGVNDVRKYPDRPVPVTTYFAIQEGGTDYDVDDVITAVSPHVGRMNHPPGYYLLFHGWTGLVGAGQLAFRSLGILVGLLSLLGLHRLARRVVPAASGALWAVGLLAVAPWFIMMSQYSRPYATALCLGIWSTVAALQLHADDQRRPIRWGLLYVVLSACGFYVVYHYVFVIAWQGLLLLMLALARHPGHRIRELGGLVLIGAGIFAGVLPWLDTFQHHLHATEGARNKDYFQGTVETDTLGTYAADLGKQLGLTEVRSDLGATLPWILGVLFALTVLVALRAFGTRAGRALLDGRARLFWLSTLLYPGLVTVADLRHGTHTAFIPKLVFMLCPLLVLLIVHAWTSLPWRRVGVTGLAAWWLLLLAGTGSDLHYLHEHPTDHEQVAAYVARFDGPDHLVVISTPARGHFHPFLLSLREAGVHETSLGHANDYGLPRLLDEAFKTDRFTLITFVNMVVPYSKEGTWEKDMLLELERIAGWLRWHTEWVGVPGVKTLELTGRPNLTIISPVRLPR